MSAVTMVAAGRELLGRDFFGWERYIDLDDLDMVSPSRCVLGQLARKDPRLSELIGDYNRRRREDLIRRGWDPADVMPMREDFFSACLALGFDDTGRRAVEYGFDFDDDTGITVDAVEGEWREVIGQELAQWTPEEES